MADDQKREFWSELWRETIKAMVLGWDLALPIFLGVLAGHFLDRWLGTVYIFTIGLLVAGIGVGYYNIARYIRRLDRISGNQRENGAEIVYKKLDDEEDSEDWE
jgi:predicted F0F1-ATPase subunit